jgi:hypothetical protein
VKADIDQVKAQVSHYKTKRVPIVPDSYFLIETPRGVAHFFLELDRATMPLKRFQDKIRGYIAYWQSGGFAARYSAEDDEATFRVLTVVASERSGTKRLQNLITTTQAVGGQNLFWFARAAALTPENVLKADVWVVAGDNEPAHLFN